MSSLNLGDDALSLVKSRKSHTHDLDFHPKTKITLIMVIIQVSIRKNNKLKTFKLDPCKVDDIAYYMSQWCQTFSHEPSNGDRLSFVLLPAEKDLPFLGIDNPYSYK